MECLSAITKHLQNVPIVTNFRPNSSGERALGEKEPEPDVMANRVKCNECHTTISQGHSLGEVKKTCIQCHEPRYGTMTDEWQKEISDRMKRLRVSLETVRVEKKLGIESRKRVELLMKEADDLLKVISEDKSRECRDYVQGLMADAGGEGSCDQGIHFTTIGMKDFFC